MYIYALAKSVSAYGLAQWVSGSNRALYSVFKGSGIYTPVAVQPSEAETGVLRRV